MLCEDLDGVGGRRKAQERGDIWVFMADSCCCRTETNTTQQSNYPPMKSRLRNNKMDNHHNKILWYYTCFQSNVADSEILINVNILSFLQAFQLLYWMCWYFHLKVGNTNKNNKFKVWTSVFFGNLRFHGNFSSERSSLQQLTISLSTDLHINVKPGLMSYNLSQIFKP